MASENGTGRNPAPGRAPTTTDNDALRPRDWAVAIGLGLVIALIVAAIFRNGIAYMFGLS